MKVRGDTNGGFGDLTSSRRAQANAPLVGMLAAQSGNGHWQWYVDRVDALKAKKPGLPTPGAYIGFLRGARPPVQPKPPVDDTATLRAEGLSAKGQIVVQRRRADGSVVETRGPTP